jgi:hypothetical protein
MLVLDRLLHAGHSGVGRFNPAIREPLVLELGLARFDCCDLADTRNSFADCWRRGRFRFLRGTVSGWWRSEPRPTRRAEAVERAHRALLEQTNADGESR